MPSAADATIANTETACTNRTCSTDANTAITTRTICSTESSHRYEFGGGEFTDANASSTIASSSSSCSD